MKYGSLFAGGGLADIGARMAGLTPIWGIELDSAIAAVAQQNDPTGNIHNVSVLDVDYSLLPRVDVLHASPPCPNFSVAKTGAAETELDMALADSVCRAITAQRPTLFTLENVRAYADSKSLARIQATLLDLDYHVTTVIVNAADYGVPQTRVRLFVLAHAGGWMQSQRPLPAKQPWRGWYQAIEDLIPTLPDSQFAPWQLARLPSELQQSMLVTSAYRDSNGRKYELSDYPSFTVDTQTLGRVNAFIADGQANDRGESMTIRHADEPFYTASASMERRPARAFVLNNSNAGRDLTERLDHDPMMTLDTDSQNKAFLMDSTEMRGQGIVGRSLDPAFTLKAADNGARAWLSAGRVVAMTPRALARFQSVPDSYVLPDKKSLACKIIGNGVAVEAYAALLRSQL